MATTSLNTVESFLHGKRLALVGASHDPRDFSRAVMRELLEIGYDVVPVNLTPGVMEGRKVVKHLSEIEEPVDWALVMVPPDAAELVVRQAAKTGIRRVWLHRGAGQGSVTPEAERAGAELGLELVSGECPMMFVGVNSAHKMHATMRRLGGSFPRRRGQEMRTPTLIDRLLAFVSVFIGFFAAVTGAIIIADPSGDGLGWTPALLRNTPFHDFLIPGLVLFTVNGLGQLLAFAMTAKRDRRAAVVTMALGAFLMGWIAFQWLWLSGTSWLQFAMFGLGALEVALGAALHHARWPRPMFTILNNLPAPHGPRS